MSTLPASLQALLERPADSLPSLLPKAPTDPALKPTISALSLPIPVRGILHLLNDDLNSAHSLVQSDESNQTSNLIHAILHRREGDFWNSKWWYGQIEHPFIKQFYGGRSEAKKFVDEVEALSKGGSSSTACGAKRYLDGLKKKQWDELSGLARWILQEYKVAF